MLYELSPGADEDLENIARYTFKTWGTAQTRKYMDALEQCIENLARGEERFKDMKDLRPGMRMVRCKHHYIFGLMRPSSPMLVVAVLHEKMDLIQRVRKRLDTTH